MVLILLADGFEEIEAVTLIDVLRRADISVTTASVCEKMVKGAHSISIEADEVLENVIDNHFDMVLLPGGLIGAKNLQSSPLVQTLLQKFNTQNKYIGAICAAPVVLFSANVLKNSFTCYPGFEKNIKHANYKNDQNVIQDENILTSKGPATAFEFALHVVKLLRGLEVYEKTKQSLLL